MRTLLTVSWFGLAAWFLWSSSRPVVGVPEGAFGERVAISAEALAGGPRRAVLSDPPKVVIGGFEQKCSDCHALFASLEVTPGNVRQHTHIVFDHGMNDRCFNCHAQEDRNKLIMHDGSLIGFDDSTVLCSKCHGTVFRDWEKGMHGRTEGSWDPGSALHSRLGCVECHDPHAPAFGQIEALPGPRTRGYREADHEGGFGQQEADNPLERWKSRRGSLKRREVVEQDQ